MGTTGFFASSKVQKQRPDYGLIPKCAACGLFRGCNSPKMPVHGDGARGVMVIGEAPGQTEDQEGRPFIGKAGSFLRLTLSQLGVKLDRDAWTTNSLICRPPHNATPDAKQISYCRPNVLNAIQQHDPKVIVLLGRSACASALQNYWKEDIGPLERWVGWQIPVAGHWICPTYHPSYLLRSKNQLLDRLFSDHLEAAFALADRPPPKEAFEKQIELLYDEGEICDAVREIRREGGWVSVDYETNSLKPEYPGAKIHSCAISNGDTTVSFPWIGDAITEVGLLLESKGTRKIASNLKFEERWTRKTYGHGVTNWGWDTYLGAHCLDNRTGICSLKFQSFVKLGVSSYNENTEPYLFSFQGHFNRINEIDLSDLLLYGGIDALLEHRLAMVQRKEMGYHE